MKKNLCLLLFFLNSILIVGQSYAGFVKNQISNEPLSYVNIGIVGKNVGTVSDLDGSFSIELNSDFDDDSLRFSYIGYKPFVVKVSDYKNLPIKDIALQQQAFSLNEIVVHPVNMEDKILGNKFKGNKIQAGFRENYKGFECGVLLKIKKSAILEEFVCSIASSSYDSIFYRLNIYKEDEGGNFVNILKAPIYIHQKINNKQTILRVNLIDYDIRVDGNTLVTLEHIADMGEGHLLFSGGFMGSACYYRKTSQGYWEKLPCKIGFNVKAKVEK